jgi:hypothetical protein
MTQLINSITGEWPRDFIEVTIITLKKKYKPTKCSDHRTIRLIAHTANIVARRLRTGIERKTEVALGEDQFAFRSGKGIREAIGMLRIISERNLDMLHRLAEGILPCQLDQINADPKENWDRLARKKIDHQIVHGTECQIRLDQGETRSVKIGRGVR